MLGLLISSTLLSVFSLIPGKALSDEMPSSCSCGCALLLKDVFLCVRDSQGK
jgi:hypothetical protein